MKVQVHSQSSVLIFLDALKINNIVYVEITKYIYMLKTHKNISL